MTEQYFYYEDNQLLAHHSLDRKPSPKDTNFAMHTHEFCEFYYCIHGKGFFRIEGTRYPLHAGDILIMRHAESHALELTHNEPYERIAIHFDPALLDSIDPEHKLLLPYMDRELGKRNLFLPSDFQTPLCSVLLEGLMEKKDDLRLQLVSSLIPLLSELRQAFKCKQNHDDGTVRDSTDKQIIDYINRHLSEHLSLDLLCARFYISKPQLCRIFKASTGSTVWDYITIKRLMAAQQQIRAGVPPTRAAITCGFNDYSVFYRAWRRRFGTSPKG